MKNYRVFRHPTGIQEVVKLGWSWPAFFFGVIWALIKNLWTIAIVTAVGLFLLGFILGSSGAEEDAAMLLNLLSLVIAIIFGMNGNAWREASLISRGYEHVDTVTAANPEGALALHLKSNGMA